MFLWFPTDWWKPHRKIPILSGDTGGVQLLHPPPLTLQKTARRSRVNMWALLHEMIHMLSRKNYIWVDLLIVYSRVLNVWTHVKTCVHMLANVFTCYHTNNRFENMWAHEFSREQIRLNGRTCYHMSDMLKWNCWTCLHMNSHVRGRVVTWLCSHMLYRVLFMCYFRKSNTVLVECT